MGSFFEGHRRDFFESWIPQVLTYIYMIRGVAVVQHPLGNGSRGVLTVCQYAYLLGSFYECFVKLRPRAAGERDDAHIMVGHYQTVGQHLQGVEGRVEDNLCLRHLPFDGVGKAEE